MVETTKSKVIRFHETENADVFKIESLPIKEPDENEIRIKIKAIGLNRAEIMFREEQYLEDPIVPCRLGYQASGIVETIGEGVSGFAIGDRVSDGWQGGETGIRSHRWADVVPTGGGSCIGRDDC
jgi:NADPH:quinone reductase-like Zn-dependent oxidoreductase